VSSSPRNDLHLYQRLLRQARPFWWHLVGLVLLSFLAMPVSLLTPLPLKIIVDSVIGAQPLPGFLKPFLPVWVHNPAGAMLVLVAALVVVISLLNQSQQLAVSLLSTYTGEKLMLSFRAQLFVQAQRISLAYHDAKGTSHSTYRILYDAPAIRDITVYSVIPFFTAVLTLVGMIYVTAHINWQLATLAMAISPVMLFLHQVSRMRLRRQWTEVETREASALSVVNEALGALRVVKAFGQEKREGERFFRHCSESMQARVRFTVVERGLGLLMGLATAVGTALVLYIGVRQVQSRAITLGELLLVMAYLSQLYEPLRALTGVTTNLQSQLARTEQAFALLDEPHDVPEDPHARPLRRAKGGVIFRNTSFAYSNGRPVVRGISLEVSPGTRVGIVGPTGAGKTTFVSLLTRFYDPTAGQILLDGIDLREYKVADLRNQFAIVLQDPVLFSTSIGENIAYARPDASHGDIVAAARAANIHDLVASLPEGYDTPVGERGMRLSGGERQRLALARAFLKDTPILILDEPTSSVDIKTEAAIMESMERLMAGRTTFLITHRVTALKGCDVVLRIEQGLVDRVTTVPPVPAEVQGSAGAGSA
jgi:ATP-binding cassette subfamily B protein